MFSSVLLEYKLGGSWFLRIEFNGMLYDILVTELEPCNSFDSE